MPSSRALRAALSFRLAYRHVRFDLPRLALSVVAIALGVALVVAIRLMNAAVLQSFLDTIDGVAGRAQLTVSAGEGLTFGEGMVETVAAVPGVALAVPLVRAVAFPDDGSGELLTVHGVDLTKEAAVRVYHRGGTEEVVADLVEFLAQPSSVVVGRGFAQRRGLGVGSGLDLVTPRGVQRFVVRGVVEPEGLAQTLGGRIVVMDLPAAERAFTADGQVNQVDVVVSEGTAVEAVKAGIAAVLPPGLRVEEPALRKDVTRRAVAGFQALLTVFAFLAVIASLVICYSRLAATFEGRLWEIGILRAVGLRRSTVFGELLKESLVLGGVGTTVGVPLGFLIAEMGLPWVANATAINFRWAVPDVGRPADAGAIGLGIATGLMAAFLAAATPALRLSRTHPVGALRLRGRDLPGLGSMAIRWAVGAGLVVLAIVLAMAQRASGVAALGGVTTAALALVACVLARPLVHGAGAWAATSLGDLVGPIGRLAAQGLRERSRRAGLTVATIAVGIGAVVMFGVLAYGFERTLVARLAARFRSDLVVSSARVTDGYRGAPLHEGLLDELEALSEVDRAVGNAAREVSFREETIVVEAYDAAGILDSRIHDWPLDPGATGDALARVAAGRAVLVSSTFARRRGLGVGATVTLETPNGRLLLPIAGVTDGQAEDAVVVVRDLYRAWWGDETVYLVWVRLREGIGPRTGEEAIMRAVGVSHRILVRTPRELIEYFAGQARQAFGLVYLMAAITSVIVLVGVGDAVIADVVEQTRTLGLLRAVGISRASVVWVVLLEGVVLGLLGSALGIAAGLGLGVFWSYEQFPALLGWTLEFHIPGSFVLSIMTVVVALCLVGTAAPALRAGRLSVTAALRSE